MTEYDDARFTPLRDSPRPSLEPGRGFCGSIGGRPQVDVSNAESIGGKPVAMPAHDGVGLNEYQRRAPVAPALRQGDKNSRSRVFSGTRFSTRCIAASCWRWATFSRTNSRWPRSTSAKPRTTTKQQLQHEADRGGQRGAIQLGRALAIVSRPVTPTSMTFDGCNIGEAQVDRHA